MISVWPLCKDHSGEKDHQRPWKLHPLYTGPCLWKVRNVALRSLSLTLCLSVAETKHPDFPMFCWKSASTEGCPNPQLIKSADFQRVQSSKVCTRTLPHLIWKLTHNSWKYGFNDVIERDNIFLFILSLSFNLYKPLWIHIYRYNLPSQLIPSARADMMW